MYGFSLSLRRLCLSDLRAKAPQHNNEQAVPPFATTTRGIDLCRLVISQTAGAPGGVGATPLFSKKNNQNSHTKTQENDLKTC